MNNTSPGDIEAECLYNLATESEKINQIDETETNLRNSIHISAWTNHLYSIDVKITPKKKHTSEFTSQSIWEPKLKTARRSPILNLKQKISEKR